MSVRVNRLPLIPGIEGLTRHVCDQLESKCGEPWQALKDVMKKDNLQNTVEAMLTEVRQLRLVCGRENVRGLSATHLDTLEVEMCRAVHSVMTAQLPSCSTSYHDFAWWAGSCERSYPVEVFSTNYDLLMEQALEESCVPYFDGFVGARRAFFSAGAIGESELARWVRLWKLHGSVNWRRTADGVVRTDSTEFDDKQSLVIHPSHMKYDQSRKMPYLALMDQFRRFLLTPSSTLITCGYSFGDEHLNDAIVDALLVNKSATAFALLFDKVDTHAAACKLGVKVRNLAALASDGGVVGSQSFKWAAPTEAGAQPKERTMGFSAGDFAVLAGEMRKMSPSETADTPAQ
jgi:hypothetical protein